MKKGRRKMRDIRKECDKERCDGIIVQEGMKVV